MRLLAIDTALAACSAAIFDFDKGVIASETLPMVRGHAEALIPLIGRVVETAGIDYAALDRIVVTVGPGSFTGLRVGVAAARGHRTGGEQAVRRRDDAARAGESLMPPPMSNRPCWPSSMHGTIICIFRASTPPASRSTIRASFPSKN